MGGDAQFTKWKGTEDFLSDEKWWYTDAPGDPHGGDVYDPNDPTNWTIWYKYTNLDPNDVMNDDNGDGIIEDNERESANFDLTGFNGSAYFQDHWNVLEVLALDAGIRMDYEKETQEADVAPRLGIAYSPNERTALRANYGIFFNQPFLWYTHFGEIKLGERDGLMHRGSAIARQYSTRFSQLNNEDLTAEKTQMWELTVERDLDGNKLAKWLKASWAVENTQATITYWRKNMTDLLEVFEYSKFDGNPANGTFTNNETNHDNYIVANTGDGVGNGVELRLRRRLTKNFEYMMAYTWMKVEGRLQSYDIDSRTYKTETVPLDWDQRNTARLTGVYYWPYKIKDFKISFQWRLDSGEPYTPYFFQDDGQIRNGPTNSKRYPLTHSMDMRFIKAFKFSDRYKLDTFINVINVYNRANVTSVDPFTDQPYFVQFHTNFYLGASLHF